MIAPPARRPSPDRLVNDATVPPAGAVAGDVPRLALRPADCARALGISPRALWTLTADRSSGIPFVKIGRMVIYPVDSLRAWLAERANGRGAG